MKMGLVSDQDFQYYADYFAMAASASVQSAKKLFAMRDVISRTDPGTLTAHYNRYVAAAAQRSLLNSVTASYEFLFGVYSNPGSVEGHFNALAEHVRDKSGFPDMDSYLSDRGMTVRQTYAVISSILGETISSANIGSE